MDAAIAHPSHGDRTDIRSYPQCPKCRHNFVRRRPGSGIIEGSLGLCWMYPFRCQICTHRFKAIQRRNRDAGHPRDRREYERIQARCPVSFSWERGYGMGTVLDVSMGGCKLSSYSLLSEGTIIQAALETMGTRSPIMIAAIVRYVCSPVFGLQFLGFKGTDKSHLGDFMLELFMTRPSSFPTPESEHHLIPAHPSIVAGHR